MERSELVAWLAGILMVGVVVTVPAACTANRHALVAEAIKGAPNPIAVKCAIESDTGNTAACIIAAMRERQP